MSAARGRAKQAGEHASSRPSDTRRAPRDPLRAVQQAAGNQALATVAAGTTPLAAGARSGLEARYGVSLGGVRVHTGGQAAEAASVQGSVAFTRGTDVYLSHAAARDPLVIAHELVHVIQQAGHGRSGTEPGLEAEASSVASGETDAISAGAAFGSVQTFWPFDDEEETKKAEEQKRDQDLANTIEQLGVLTRSTEEWKKYASDPAIGGWLRAHPDAVDPLRTNRDYQAWLADPKSKPPGATDLPKRQEIPLFDASKPRGKVQGTGETVPDLERRAEKTVWKSWSPKQKADWAHGVVEAERQRFVESMTPEKGSWEEAMWTIGETTGSYSLARAWTGESEWGVPLSGEERFNEAVLGGAKFTQAVASTELALPEWQAAEGAGLAPRYAEELLQPPTPGPLRTAPVEGAPLTPAPSLGSGGKTIDELAEAAQQKAVPGQDVELPQNALAAPRGGPGGGFVKPGGELEMGGLRVQTEPQAVPDPAASMPPKAGPTTDVAADPQELPRRGATDDIAGPRNFPGIPRGEPPPTAEQIYPPLKSQPPAPVGKTIPAPSLENIPPEAGAPARASGQSAGPLIDETPRELPGAHPERGPVVEPDTPPPVKAPPAEERGDALLPGERQGEGPLEGPGRDTDRGPLIAGSRTRDPIETFINSRYLIDMRKHPNPRQRTAEGHPRDYQWFWKQMLKKHPALFSQDNVDRIKAGDSPIADKQWLKYHPGQKFFEGDELRHHHVDKGPLTAGIPETFHRVFHGPLHYYHEPGSRYVSSKFKKAAPTRPKRRRARR